MTVRQMIKELERQGYVVTFKQRTDRGVRITSISDSSSSKKYTASAGNKAARQILNQKLSKAQKVQLKNMKEGRPTPRRPKPAEIPNELRKQLRQVQKEWRENNREGKITVKNIREAMKKEGLEGAKRMLDQASKFARGIAYEGNIDAFILRLEDLYNKRKSKYIEEAIEILKNNKDSIKEENFKQILQSYYDDIVNSAVKNYSYSVKKFVNKVKKLVYDSSNRKA